MKVYSKSGETIYQGSCLTIMQDLDHNSIDAIVTDPPYGLTANKKGGSGDASLNLKHPAGRSRITTGGGFMGQKWDAGVPCVEFWQESLRVAKPGAHLLAFGGTRTFHRLTCAIEDAGWEIRDCIMWVYGSGFPKSHDVNKAIDKESGAERERIRGVRSAAGSDTYAYDAWSKEFKDSVLSSDAITTEAQQWSGWGTALKPAWEPIIVSRKPLDGTVAQNVLQHGTGAINIDACRVEHVTVDNGSLATNPHLRDHINAGNGSHIFSTESDRRVVTPHELGRFPANLIHDGSDEVVELFPEQSGGGHPTRRFADKTRNTYGGFTGNECPPGIGPSSGNASRFFYCAKESDRDILPAKEFPLFGESHAAVKNTHPTVKPVELMRYLCRLVTPPGGLILDPFAGSGTTLVAAKLEGFASIGIELNPDYVKLILGRLGQEF